MSRRRASARPWLVSVSVCMCGAGIMLTAARSAEASAGQVQGPRSTSRREPLREPRTIEGVPCERFASYSVDGQLVSCVLSTGHTIGPVALPANTFIALRPDRSVADVHLGENMRYDGHTCRGSGPDDWMTGFYPDGRLRYCFLAADETIDGVPCRKGTFWGEISGGVMVQFHPDGKLKSCRLTADHTVAGTLVKKGQRIWLPEVVR